MSWLGDGSWTADKVGGDTYALDEHRVLVWNKLTSDALVLDLERRAWCAAKMPADASLMSEAEAAIQAHGDKLYFWLAARREEIDTTGRCPHGCARKFEQRVTPAASLVVSFDWR